MPVRIFRRRPQYIFMYWGGVGLTIWRRGALSFQVMGHFLQIVFGDWWKAMPRERVH